MSRAGQGEDRSRDEHPQPRRIMGRGPHSMGAVEKAKDARGALKRLLAYLGDYKVHLTVIMLLTVLSSLLALAGPY